MTNLIVIGNQQNKAIKKTIEFHNHIRLIDSDDVAVEPVDNEPIRWNNIELICKDYAPNLDLMFVYDDANDRSNGILIIGRWNDGVVK